MVVYLLQFGKPAFQFLVAVLLRCVYSTTDQIIPFCSLPLSPWICDTDTDEASTTVQIPPFSSDTLVVRPNGGTFPHQSRLFAICKVILFGPEPTALGGSKNRCTELRNPS